MTQSSSRGKAVVLDFVARVSSPHQIRHLSAARDALVVLRVPRLESLARIGSSSCFLGDVRDQNLILIGGGWPANNTVAKINLKAAGPTFTLGPTLPSAKAQTSGSS